MPGDKGFTLTGQLGDVMKESAQAALSYVRNRAESLGIDPGVLQQVRPASAHPGGRHPQRWPQRRHHHGDGPGQPAHRPPGAPNLGMTGEITLRGKVLPIGGVKEKVLAAHRAGLDTVILPKRNEADLDDVPETVRKQMNFILVDTVDEVLVADAALQPRRSAPEKGGAAGGRGKVTLPVAAYILREICCVSKR